MSHTLLAFLLLLQAPGRDATLTTPDRTCTVRALEIKEVLGEPTVEFEDAGRKVALKCSEVADISFAPVSAPANPAATDVQIVLWTGDILCGSLLEAASGGVRIRSASLGETTVKFDRIDTVRFSANRRHWPARAEKLEVDVVQAKSGDGRRGTIKSISSAGVQYLSEVLKGKSVTMKPEDCALVFMASPLSAQPQPPKTLYAIVQLKDGTAIQGTLTGMAAGTLTFADLFGEARSIAADSLAGIHFKNGRVVYVSDLPVARAKEEANFIRDPAGAHPGDKQFPFQRDLNVQGGPLRICGQEFRKGLGAHSKSELVFDLAGQYQKFEATVGIDDCSRDEDPPRGSVVFRILADGKPVFDSGVLGWKDKGRAVSVPLQGVKELTLVVDWGEDFEIGDCADWAGARLIK